MEEYAALWEEAQRTEARIFFADEAHPGGRGMRGKWVLKGEPALGLHQPAVWGEGAILGSDAWRPCNSGTSAAFLDQLRQRRSGQLNVIWDKSWGGTQS